MKILLCNDDGISAPGITALAEVFGNAGHEVFIIAPDGQRSAASHCLTMYQPLIPHEFCIPGAQRAVSLQNGTPTDCARLGMRKLFPEADLVLSGINRGWNAGMDCLYSGTVAAAMEGALSGKQALAVSLNEQHEEYYLPAAQAALQAAEHLMEHPLPAGMILNMNYPSTDHPLGFRRAQLGTTIYSDRYEESRNDRVGTFYWLIGGADRSAPAEGSDLYWLSRNYISLTALTVDMTAQKATNEMSVPDSVSLSPLSGKTRF